VVGVARLLEKKRGRDGEARKREKDENKRGKKR